jgi:hypothetical protein
MTFLSRLRRNRNCDSCEINPTGTKKRNSKDSCRNYLPRSAEVIAEVTAEARAKEVTAKVMTGAMA